MSCSKTSNNKYFECPARMSDGRFCTDYRPNSYVNGAIKVSNNIQNSYQYRLFLQRNADQLFQLNNNLFFARNGSGPCMKPYNQGTVLSNQNEINCNTQSCVINSVDKNGLGLGINYNSSPSAQFNQPIVVNNQCSDMQNLFNKTGL